MGSIAPTVEWLPQPPRDARSSRSSQPLVPVLREALARLQDIGRFIEPDYEDAGWVSYRLAELLPLDPAAAAPARDRRSQ